MKRRMTSAMIGLRLAVRGLWYRRSTTLIVLVLAVVASRGGSRRAALLARCRGVDRARHLATRRRVHPRRARLASAGRSPGPGRRAGQGAVRGGVDAQQVDASGVRDAADRLSDARHLPPDRRTDQGQCRHRPGRRTRRRVCSPADGRPAAARRHRLEGMVSRRSLTVLGAKVGDTVPIDLTELTADESGAVPPTLLIKVVGSYDPVSVADSYWVGQPYFSEYFPVSVVSGLGSAPPTADPVFLGPGTAAQAHITGLHGRRAGAGQPGAPRRRTRPDRAGAPAEPVPQCLPAGRCDPAAVRVDPGRQTVATSCASRRRSPSPSSSCSRWWTLFLVVGAATEERSPELGLAKLRGLSQGQTGRFGLAEIVLLLVLAAPLGTVAGIPRRTRGRSARLCARAPRSCSRRRCCSLSRSR